MDASEHARMPKVAEACTDEAEVLALAITRFIAAGYMTQDVACWDAGHQCAEEVLGPREAPRIVAAMAGVMRALRVERQGSWSFMPATCCRVTQDEIGLLKALGHARSGDQTGLAAAAQALTGKEAAPRLAAALQVAAEAIESIKPMLVLPSSSRRMAPTTLH